MFEYRRLRGPKNFGGVIFSDLGKKLAEESSLGKDLENLGIKYHNLINVDSNGVVTAPARAIIGSGTDLGAYYTLQVFGQTRVNGDTRVTGSLVAEGLFYGLTRSLFGASVTDDGVSRIQTDDQIRLNNSVVRKSLLDKPRVSSDTLTGAVTKGNKWVCIARLTYMTNISLRGIVSSQNSEDSFTIDLNTTYFADRANMKVRHQSYNTRIRYVGISSEADSGDKYIWLNVDHSEFDMTVSVIADGVGFISAPFTVAADGSQPTQRLLASLNDKFTGNSSTEITLFDAKFGNSGVFEGHLSVNASNNDTDHGRGLTIGSGPYRCIFGLTNVQGDGSYNGLTKVSDQAWIGARDSSGFVVGKHDGAALRFTSDRIYFNNSFYYGDNDRKPMFGFEYETETNSDYTVIGGPAHSTNGVGSGVKIMIGSYGDYRLGYRLTPTGRHLYGHDITDDGVCLIQAAGRARFSAGVNLPALSVGLSHLVETPQYVQVSPGVDTTLFAAYDGRGHLFLVCGDNGSEGFTDIIMTGFVGPVTVVSSQTSYGVAFDRTYTRSGDSIRLNHSGPGTYSVRSVHLMAGAA